MAKYSNTKAKINEKIATNGRQTVTGSILNDVLQTMVDSLGADYQFGGLVQPGSSFTAGEQPVVFLATTPGTYTNFGGLVVADGEVALLVWSGTAWSKQTPDIATRTEVSQLGQQVIYDATMNNAGSPTFASLSALLSDANIDTLIPTAVRAGGMSIRFVQTSDNKYVQFRLMADSFSTTVTDWQGVDNEPTAGSENLVKSGGVFEKHTNILLKEDGTISSSAKINQIVATPVCVLSGVNLKRDTVYTIELKCDSAVPSTIFGKVYDEDGNNLRNVNINTNYTSALILYTPTQDYYNSYIEIYAINNNCAGLTINAVVTEGYNGNISFGGKLNQLFGEDVIVLPLSVTTVNYSTNIDFNTTGGHKYRIYFTNKQDWTIETVSAGSVVFVIRTKNNGSYTNITGKEYTTKTFDRIGNYIDFEATTETSNILIRSDINKVIYYTVVDVTNIPTKQKLEDIEKELSKYNLDDINNSLLASTGYLAFTHQLVRGDENVKIISLLPQRKYKIKVTLSEAISSPLYCNIQYGPNWSTVASITIPTGETSGSSIVALGEYGKQIRIHNYTTAWPNGATVDYEFEELENYNTTRSVVASNPLRFKRYYCHLFADNADDLQNIIIPFESQYDIDIAKRLGFDVIEANVLVSSDEEYFVIHGSNGAFGPLFEHIDGTTDISSTLVSSVTSSWIKENVRFKSVYAKYRTPILTLDEWLRVCKSYSMVPLVQMRNAEQYALVDNIMGKGNYIAYDGSRGLTSSILSGANTSFHTPEEVIAYGNQINRGTPYLHMFSSTELNSMTDEQIKSIVDAVHESGWFIMTSYLNEQQNQRVKRLGFDIIAATKEINPIIQGNIVDISLGGSINEFDTDGVFSNGVISLTDGQFVKKENVSQNVFLAALSIYIRFEGTIYIQIGKIAQNVTSDGKMPMVVSSYLLESKPEFAITSVGNVTIYDLCFKSSKR